MGPVCSTPGAATAFRSLAFDNGGMTDDATAPTTGLPAPQADPTATAPRLRAFATATFAQARVRSLGSAEAEVRAAFAPGAAVATPLLASTVLRAVGADAAPFLHGQLANDVQGLRPGSARRSLLLNHRGHAMAEATVLRDAGDAFRLVVDDHRGDWVLRTLVDHVVFDQVEIAAVPGMALLTVQGDGAAAALLGLGLTLPAEEEHHAIALQGVPGTIWPRARAGGSGYDLVVACAALEGWLTALAGAGVTPVGEDALDAARVAARAPTAGGEGGDGILPQEAGLEGALSYRKGCYLGQEIMARIEARGTLRRALAALAIEGRPEAVELRSGARPDVLHHGKVVGRIGTLARMQDGELRALAVLRTDLPADAELTVAGCRAWRAS